MDKLTEDAVQEIEQIHSSWIEFEVAGDDQSSLPSLPIEGRTSYMIKKEVQQRANLLQGMLDMLVLRTLLYGPAHGHQIGKHIQRTTNDFLQMQHGSLYPALHRPEE
jgi:hypothetical protein